MSTYLLDLSRRANEANARLLQNAILPRLLEARDDLREIRIFPLVVMLLLERAIDRLLDRVIGLREHNENHADG